MSMECLLRGVYPWSVCSEGFHCVSMAILHSTLGVIRGYLLNGVAYSLCRPHTHYQQPASGDGIS